MDRQHTVEYDVQGEIGNDLLLKVENLQTSFFMPEGTIKAVDDVCFHVDRAETLGLVGESGCGKSAIALSIMGLIAWPPGRIVGGRIFLEGEDLVQLPPSKLREIRGNKISMIFQEPMSSLNPVYTLGRQIAEVYMEHQGASKKQALEQAREMLDKLGIPAPAKRIHEYPHNLSGGMRQRVMIAMALACNPKLILADEPTTALDVTIQAQILELMAELQDSMSTSIILITHNLGVVAEYTQRIIIMYAGKIVEEAPVVTIFEQPLHPYTVGLLASIPRLGAKSAGGKQRLAEIPGVVPSLYNLPQGCNFHPRCSKTREICRQAPPPLVEVESKHRVACWAVTEGWE
ncbi:MAG: ABC transporter ATP-binding protein [Deltaproteobacteria bacterium]|nr:ABC transporter ATP-binding protein [Deltaproteobacteria bacterium]